MFWSQVSMLRTLNIKAGQRAQQENIGEKAGFENPILDPLTESFENDCCYIKAERILAGRISDENGERAKKGSGFHFRHNFNSVWRCFIIAVHVSFLCCQSYRYFQYYTEYSCIACVFTTCLSSCINCSKVTKKKRENRPVVKTNWRCFKVL